MNETTRRISALALRDGLLVGVTAALWVYTLQIGPASTSWIGAVHVVTALMTVFVGYLLHEWGHLFGAWLLRSAVEYPSSINETMFLFRFDNGRNNRSQFFSMALGGFVSSFITVVVLFWLLPWSLLASKVALALTVLGVIATFVIEVPEFWGVLRGGPMPNGAAFVTHADAGKPHATTR